MDLTRELLTIATSATSVALQVLGPHVHALRALVPHAAPARRLELDEQIRQALDYEAQLRTIEARLQELWALLRPGDAPH